MIRLALASCALAATLFAAPRKDIVDTAMAQGSFRNLTAALKAAGLVDALRADGPFTVFAPADAAFARLPEKALARLLSEEERPALQRLLKFHVVPGRLTAGVLLTMDRAPTLNGQRLRFRIEEGVLRVGGATVLTADIPCANGVIHVIDRVLQPEERSVVEVARVSASLRTLAEAIRAGGLEEALSGDGPFTVLAPTDDAFARLPKGALEDLLRPANRDKLVRILKHHVIPGRATAAEAISLRQAKTLAGTTLPFAYRDGRLQAGGAAVRSADVPARNGVIHVIDEVLLPPDPAARRAAAVPALLELAIERGVPLFNAGQVEACAAIYEVAAEGVLALGDDVVAAPERAALRAALDAKTDARDRAWALRRVFDRILVAPAARAAPARTAFEPVMEAPLPEGFPAPGPLNEIVVKRYPRYRMAKASGGMFAFGTLFQHIKKNKIEMTAPVEMTMEDAPRAGSMGQKDMAFLYASTELGETGQDGRVKVVDVEPLTVLSVGLLGPMNAKKLAEAKAAIDKRLAEGGWERAGDWRLMGYNSPMIRADRRFYEVQLPVRRAD